MLSLFEKFIEELNLSHSELLTQALTHKSFSKDFPEVTNYERLEFLGDAVLKLVFSEYLHTKFPNLDEGKLSKYRSRLISDDLLGTLSQEIGLSKHVRIGKMLKGQKNIPKSVYGDALEALIAIIYLEKDYKNAKDFILKAWENHIDSAIQDSVEKNYKALVIEKLQGKHGKAPEFKIINSSGDAHDMTFSVGVYFEDKLIAKGSGKSKKLAGQCAAKAALGKLK